MALVQYPIYKTYNHLSKDQINYDAVDTIMRRINMMSDSERNEMGLTDEFLQSNKLYQYIEDGRIKFTYDRRSTKHKPTYHIHIDVAGDGMFSNLSNPNSPDASFMPEGQLDKFHPTKKSVIQKQAYDNLYNKIRADNAQIRNIPALDGAAREFFGFLMNIGNLRKEGLQGIENIINETPAISNIYKFFFGQDVDFNVDTFQELGEQAQYESMILEQTQQLYGDESRAAKYSGVFQFDKDSKMLEVDNIFLNVIGKHEGGFYATVYDPTYRGDKTPPELGGVQTVSKDSVISKDLYEYTTSDKGDPTIGYGFSINPNTAGGKRNIKLLEDMGYDIDKLTRGEQKLKMIDGQRMFMQIVDQTLKEVETLIGMDLRGNRNALLAVVLVDLAYLSGTGKTSFIGPRFRKALSNYMKTGDKKYIGAFQSYDGSDEAVKGKTLAGYEPTLLNELYNDGKMQKEKGMGGNYTRFEYLSGLLNAWSQGSMIDFPALSIEDRFAP